ncbi:MAG TPA: C4-type zinc ribbon domain-containing protein [Chloroflexota bacterium]|nr:C4-type zinc ribbon domain-containing protein [Chloroflexota bacterium]
MAVATQLFRLEQLDTGLEQCEAALADIRGKLQRNPRQEAVEAEARNLASRAAAMAAEQRKLEGELADVETRIKRDDVRMYSGQIVDSRELASLQKELEHYAVQRNALEERVLETMEGLEELQDAAAAARTRADEGRRQWDEERPRLEAERGRVAQDLERLQREREALASELDARSLHMYQRLRSSAGHAVSQVSNGVCQGCRVNLPPKDVQHARAGALVTCTNCARILFVGG